MIDLSKSLDRARDFWQQQGRKLSTICRQLKMKAPDGKKERESFETALNNSLVVTKGRRLKRMCG